MYPYTNPNLITQGLSMLKNINDEKMYKNMSKILLKISFFSNITIICNEIIAKF